MGLPINPQSLYITAAEQRGLQYWISQTGPTLAKYGGCKTFYTVVVPHFAHQFNAVRHLLVACAMVHEQYGIDDVDEFRTLSPDVFRHYQAAIDEIVATQQSQLYLIIASAVAWIFEALQRNLVAAKIHIEATKKLVHEFSASSSTKPHDQDLLERYIRPCIEMGEAYNKAMYDPEIDVGSHISEESRIIAKSRENVRYTSLSAARGIISDQILNYTSPEADVTAHEQKLFVCNWKHTLHFHCRQGIESILHKQALHLLMIVAMALLPESEVGLFNYAAKPSHIDFVLIRVEEIMLERDKIHPTDQAEIDETLRFVLNHVLCHFQNSNHVQQAGQLLKSLIHGQMVNSPSFR